MPFALIPNRLGDDIFIGEWNRDLSQGRHPSRNGTDHLDGLAPVIFQCSMKDGLQRREALLATISDNLGLDVVDDDGLFRSGIHHCDRYVRSIDFYSCVQGHDRAPLKSSSGWESGLIWLVLLTGSLKCFETTNRFLRVRLDIHPERPFKGRLPHS